MWAVWNGERQDYHNNQNKGNSCMSKLWMSLLDSLWEVGTHCGCHQLPERSFFLKGYQFPVCARCTGVFIGQIALILSRFLKIKLKLITYLTCLLIMGFDWFIQFIQLIQSTNLRRLVTGILGGFGILGLYVSLFRFLWAMSYERYILRQPYH